LIKIIPDPVAGFSIAKSDRHHATIHHESTTNSPSKNHVQSPVFAKTPSKTHNHHAKNKKPDRNSIGPFMNFRFADGQPDYWL
jgi:hypothetical protein